MRLVPIVMSVVAVVVLAAGLAAQVKPSFAGNWMVVGPDGRGDPSATLTITQNAAAMTLENIGCDPAPVSAKLTYKLDGSVSMNTTSSGRTRTEQRSTATWVGNRVVVSIATGAGQETRTFSMEGENLVVETAVPARNGSPAATRVTYTRYECGHGG